MTATPEPAPSAEPTKRLEIDPSLALGEALALAMGGIVAHAQSQAALAPTDPEKAVHTYRKSVRRARALLRLLKGLIPKEELQALAEEMRAAMRETSAARDADVMVGLVALHPRKSKTRAALDGLEALLREHQSAVHSEGRMAEALRAGGELLGRVPAQVAGSLPSAIDRRALRGALKASHKRAREAFLRAQETLEEEDVHDWRKRVKELRYQLEFLEPLTGVLKQHARLAELAESLGEVTDLIVLRDCALAHRDRLDAGSVEQLIRKLEAKVEKKSKQLFEHTGDLFADRPSEFADRVLKRVGAGSASGRFQPPAE